MATLHTAAAERPPSPATPKAFGAGRGQGEGEGAAPTTAPTPTPEQLAAYQRRADAIESANADPLPGPLLDAFLPEPLLAAGFALRQPVASDLAILKRINSPILQELEQLAKPVEERIPCPFSEEAAWELFYLWTRPVTEARAALASGPQAFRETALRVTSDRLPLTIVTQGAAMMAALAQNFIRSFATAIEYQSKPSGDGTVFTAPPPGAPTASAGGSI